MLIPSEELHTDLKTQSGFAQTEPLMADLKKKKSGYFSTHLLFFMGAMKLGATFFQAPT